MLSFFPRILSGPPVFTLQQLGAALHLATMWGFDAVRAYTIGQIDQQFNENCNGFDPFDRLDLADRTNVPKWRRPAFQIICSRKEALTLEEGLRLGMKRVIVITAIRERCRSTTAHFHSCYQCRNGYSGCGVVKDVSTALNAEKESLELE